MKKTRLQPPYNENNKTNFKARKKSGCYLIYKDNVLRYVGYSGTDVYKAMYRHFQSWNDRRQIRVTYTNLKNIKVRVVYTNTPQQASKLEKALIIKLKPTDNPTQYWLNYDTDKSEDKIYSNFMELKANDIVTIKDTDLPF